MRRKTKNPAPTKFSHWEFVGADIERELNRIKAVIVPLRWAIAYRKFPQDQINEFNQIKEPKVWADYVMATMTVAIEPKTLEVALNDPSARILAERFAGGFCEWPDLMLKIFQIARAKWHKKNPSFTEIIQRFLVTNPWIKSDPQRPPVIISADVQDKDIAKAIEKKLGFKSVSARQVQDARYAMRLPKRELLISGELHAAIHHLRSLGFCRFW
ncbi:MAG TPA: hypothetical protein VG077_11195 [Verrucomicrobiae bacterium]|nr:hypothetical protein [Verrucomicrobiae bacterium]